MAQFQKPVLVTGAAGCIGAWVVAALHRDGNPVVVYDLSDDRRRLQLLLDDAEAAQVPWHRGDVADPEALDTVVAANDVGAIIHLAALQVPFCKADPLAGARANVVGYVNVLEAARRHHIKHLVYTSSIAAMPAAGARSPSTIYGAYKAADEAVAQVYWQDWSVPSIGLRPHTVYGLGRDQGLTSAPTKAMLAAVAGQPHDIPFTGQIQFQYAGDVAAVIIGAAAAMVEGAPVYDIGGAPVAIDDIIAAIRRVAPAAKVTATGDALPFPPDRDNGPLRVLLGDLPETPLDDGVAATMTAFRDLLARGLVAPDPA